MPEGVKQRSVRGLAVHQDARYIRNRELRIAVNHSCNKLHAMRGQILRIAYGFYRQTLAGDNQKLFH